MVIDILIIQDEGLIITELSMLHAILFQIVKYLAGSKKYGPTGQCTPVGAGDKAQAASKPMRKPRRDKKEAALKGS